jgi:inner membrane protein
MDSITQGLLGGAIAQLGFRQRIGRDATWVAAAAAVVPDLDILITPLMGLLGADVGPLDRVVIHRGYSHSLLVAPLLALPMALLWWAIRRRRAKKRGDKPETNRFGLLYALLALAVISQPLLDVFTSYGTQILLPVTDHRFALDAVPIVDIFYTPLLILTLGACYLLRKIRGQERSRRVTLIVGWIGVLLSIGYLAAGRLAHDAAIERGRVALAGERIERIEAYPMIPTILLWRVVARLPDEWVAMRVHLRSSRAPRMRRAPASTGETELIKRARALAEARTFAWFSGGMVRYVARDGVVELHDMRYAMSPEEVEALWVLKVTFNGAGRVRAVAFDRRHRRRDMGRFASRVWRETWNP